jgi:hypothetical protein
MYKHTAHGHIITLSSHLRKYKRMQKAYSVKQHTDFMKALFAFKVNMTRKRSRIPFQDNHSDEMWVCGHNPETTIQAK